MRFRPSDRLDELADHANCAVENIERSFDQIRAQTGALQAALQKIETVESTGVKEARDALDEIDGTLQRFTFRPAVNKFGRT